MKTMQKFFMMMVVVLMTGFMTSCGSDDDNNSDSLGTYTIGLTVSEQGTLSDLEVTTMNSVLKNMEQTFTNVSQFRAKEAFEASFKSIDTSKLGTDKDYTLEYFLKDGNGSKIASHLIIVKDGKVTLK
jgi:hypothetical protein